MAETRATKRYRFGYFATICSALSEWEYQFFELYRDGTVQCMRDYNSWYRTLYTHYYLENGGLEHNNVIHMVDYDYPSSYRIVLEETYTSVMLWMQCNGLFIVYVPDNDWLGPST